MFVRKAQDTELGEILANKADKKKNKELKPNLILGCYTRPIHFSSFKKVR